MIDRKSDYEQGREDALNGFPRESTRPFYRKGYDKGLSEFIRKQSQPYFVPDPEDVRGIGREG
jgi:hypothetical protein